MSTTCVVCGSTSQHIGPLPASNLFAGRSLKQILPGGALYRCTQCWLGFRYPRLDKAALDDLYSSGLPSNWDWTPSARTDWALAADIVRRRFAGGAAVLDVGCFDGSFLATLPEGTTHAGIEIMPDAAARAAARGVRMLGSDFACLETTDARFDIVTAFDVIEHVENPLGFLQLLSRVLSPRGIIIVSTGNLDAWTWGLMGSRYWYCAIPEHISFLSERWFEHAAPLLGMSVAEVRTFPHAREPLRRRAFEAISNVTFLVFPRLVAAMRRRGYGHITAQLDAAVQADYPPGWASAADHFLVTLERARTRA